MTAGEQREAALDLTAHFVAMRREREHGLIMQAESVRGILAGTKSQTRRVITARNTEMGCGRFKDVDLDQAAVDAGYVPQGGPAFLKAPVRDDAPDHRWYRARPRVFPGDRIWVRETWRAEEREDLVDGVRFRADDAFVPIGGSVADAHAWIDVYDNGRHGDRWRPSIFMPRWAARIVRPVTAVRPERLQEITAEDVAAEGIEEWADAHCAPGWRERLGLGPDLFALGWDDINGHRPGCSWRENPWVWVYTFEKG